MKQLLSGAVRLGLPLLLLTAFSAVGAPAAKGAPATPAPSATPPAAPAANDPCGGPSRLLATLNRPTIGYSACAAEKGTAIFEEGYQHQLQGTDFADSLVQYPQSFIRIGVRPRFEADLIGPYFNELSTSSNGVTTRSSGYQDSGLGVKYELQPSGRYTIGIDGLYTAPNGSRAFTSGGSTETINLDVSYAATQSFSIGTTQAFSSASGFRSNGTEGRYAAWMPSVVLTQQFDRNDQIYAEYVYLDKLAPDQGGRAFLDYGVQHLLGTRFEVDLEFGNSITAGPNLEFKYVGVGFGWQVR